MREKLRRKSSTDKEAPSRENLRKENELPRCKKSSTAKDDPIRKKLRNERELPR
jgi:hypothetical protein